MSEPTPQPPAKPKGASPPEQQIRHAPDHQVAPDEKRKIAEESSRQEDA